MYIEPPNYHGIFQTDLVFKALVELTIEGIKRNPWLIEDAFQSLLINPYLREKYGYKEIQRAKEFFLNNKIPVYMAHRIDQMEMPCITIKIGSGTEDFEKSTLAEMTNEVEDLEPGDINKPIPYIIKPSKIEGYDQQTGEITYNQDVNFDYIVEGMAIINTETGVGYQILEKDPENFILKIAPDTDIAGMTIGAIIPQYAFYRVRREQSFFKETVTIGIHAHGDPANITHLYNIMLYGILRYREGLLEAQNFELARLQTTDIAPSPELGVENSYSRFIIISGSVQNTWLKSPKRILENSIIGHYETNSYGDEFYTGGIRIEGMDIDKELEDEFKEDLWTEEEEEEDN